MIDRARLRAWIRNTLQLAVMVVLLATARASLADHYEVPSGSMEPTVETGDQIIVNKAAYGLRIPLTHTYAARFRGPQAGDVVVLDSPDEDKVLLKRVVATPGTTVEVRGGRVLLDGVEAGRVDRSISLDSGGGPDFGPMTLPADRYLVLGDNRGDSRDGRYFGLVTRDSILGRAVGVFWRDGFTWDSL
jgi:signal peptidase I